MASDRDELLKTADEILSKFKERNANAEEDEAKAKAEEVERLRQLYLQRTGRTEVKP